MKWQLCPLAPTHLINITWFMVQYVYGDTTVGNQPTHIRKCRFCLILFNYFNFLNYLEHFASLLCSFNLKSWKKCQIIMTKTKVVFWSCSKWKFYVSHIMSKCLEEHYWKEQLLLQLCIIIVNQTVNFLDSIQDLKYICIIRHN